MSDSGSWNKNRERRAQGATSDEFYKDLERLSSLSDRQIEIMRLISEGLATREIASKLNLSIKTVEFLRANIGKTFNLRDNFQLVKFCERWSARLAERSKQKTPESQPRRLTVPSENATEVARELMAGVLDEIKREGQDPKCSEAHKFLHVPNKGDAKGEADIICFLKRSVIYFEVKARIGAGIPLQELDLTAYLLGLTQDEMARKLGTSVATLHRARKNEDQRLDAELSDRLIRFERLLAKAADLFDGNLEHARNWLHREAPALGNERPIDAAATEAGAREVENVIMRLENGVFT